MINSRYSRNRIYISEKEQNVISRFKIFLGGAGIGSNIAECALRLGFENITIVDGDNVEESNLNRQNYLLDDIGESKANRLKNRLLSINPYANITIHNCYINESNVDDLIKAHDVCINALDFTSDIPFIFDNICREKKIPVIHPFNLGWAGLITVVNPEGQSIEILPNEGMSFEESMVKYIIGYFRFWGKPKLWLQEILDDFLLEKGEYPPPQLSIGSWIAAAQCTDILYRLATNNAVKYFPDFYFTTALEDVR